MTDSVRVRSSSLSCSMLFTSLAGAMLDGGSSHCPFLHLFPFLGEAKGERTVFHFTAEFALATSYYA